MNLISNLVNLVVYSFFAFCIFIVLGGVYFTLYQADQQRQECEQDHGTCVDTTDGWKPYDP